MEIDFESQFGFVYVIRNPSFPEWVKIGRTNNVNQRIRSLNTAAPTRFVLCKAWVMQDEKLAERACHEALHSIRAESGAEFFTVSTIPVDTYCAEYETDVSYSRVDEIIDLIEAVFVAKEIHFENAWHPHLEG